MFTYRPSFVPTKVLIIGCGGTGSRLVPLLAQFIKTCAWIPDPEMTLIDDDIVEEKNLFRQNFIAPDVGKSKAEVLANRYSRAFNMNINAMQYRVPEAKIIRNLRGSDTAKHAEYTEIIKKYGTNSIIVLCVDSPQARRDILAGMLEYGVGARNSVLLLDSGNENDFGQVSMSTMTVPVISKNIDLNILPNSIPGDIELELIPMDTSYFKEMQATNTPSCADLDQTMAINTMMAVTMFGIIQNFYYSKPFLYHRINISLSHGATPQYMNTDFIKKCSKPDNMYFADCYVNSVDITKPVKTFIKDVFDPFQAAIKQAEEAKKLADLKAEEEKADKLKQAVLDTMPPPVSVRPLKVVRGDPYLNELDRVEEWADIEAGEPLQEVTPVMAAARPGVVTQMPRW